jgi:hypothetical protein
MGILKRLGALLVWVLASVVALLAVVLCVTLILLPLGLPLMGVALRMYGFGMKLMLPRLPDAGDVRRSTKRSWRRLSKRAQKAPPVKKLAPSKAQKLRRRLSG